MVFIIADEHRDLKPYAIPVQALPLESIKDAKLRELRDELKATMENLGNGCCWYTVCDLCLLWY